MIALPLILSILAPRSGLTPAFLTLPLSFLCLYKRFA